jgi:putrescine transport system permease protein
MAARGEGQSRLGRRLVVGLPFLWLFVFFLAPFAIVARMSLSSSAQARPPYVPVFDLSEGLSGVIAKLGELGLDNYRLLMEEPLYLDSFISSVVLAATATVLLILIGFPIAYAMARAPDRWRPILVMLVVLPFWTSFLIRVYAWIGILKPEGLLNQFLLALGVISQPLDILNTNTAVQIGMVYSYLPFMILPLYASLEKLDGTLLEAAQDLGCPPWKAFWLVTVPLAMPGVIAGSFLVFIPALGEFVIPDLLGGSDTLMIGKTLWSEFFGNRDWPLASAVAVVLLIVIVGPLVLYRILEQRRLEAGR